MNVHAEPFEAERPTLVAPSLNLTPEDGVVDLREGPSPGAVAYETSPATDTTPSAEHAEGRDTGLKGVIVADMPEDEHGLPAGGVLGTQAGRHGDQTQSTRLARNVLLAAIIFICLGIVTLKIQTLLRVQNDQFWVIYGCAVAFYILGRFALSPFYKPERAVKFDEIYYPSISIIVPAMNEGKAIGRTLECCLNAEYAAGKFQLIAVDDGSTDDTLSYIAKVAEESNGRVEVLSFPRNRGKRHAMAAGARISTGELLVFIDSDSLIEPDALLKIAKYFVDPRVGAVCGHTDVENSHHSLLGMMQAVHYFVAFKAYKATEALFSSVTCCSGCFSAYRASAVARVLDEFEGQTFMGAPSTFGDDRSLTNSLLPNWRVLYAPDARARTTVPADWSIFVRQQLRWKKSWLRENTRAARFMWRKPLPMVIFFYLGLVLPLLGPQMLIRALVIAPTINGIKPGWYLGGIVVVLLLQGLYFRMFQKQRIWLLGSLASLAYVFLAVWQLPYAIATIRDGKWGTR